MKYLMLGLNIFTLLTSCFTFWFVNRQNKRSRAAAEDALRFMDHLDLKDKSRQERKGS